MSQFIPGIENMSIFFFFFFFFVKNGFSLNNIVDKLKYSSDYMLVLFTVKLL